MPSSEDMIAVIDPIQNAAEITNNESIRGKKPPNENMKSFKVPPYVGVTKRTRQDEGLSFLSAHGSAQRDFQKQTSFSKNGR